MCDLKQRAVRRAAKGKTHHWLTAVPVAAHHFDLSPTEFRDAIALRYALPFTELPESCDGCGASADNDHLLECTQGGLVVRRHNEVRDALGDLLAAAIGRQVIREPILVEGGTVDGETVPGLQPDLAVRGIFHPQAEAVIDVCVVHTDAQSYRKIPPADVLEIHAKRKHAKYDDESNKRRAKFIPFVLSVDGMLAKESERLIQSLIRRLSCRWNNSYSVTAGWVKTRLSFALLRATNQCIRSSRVKWRSLGTEDGAAIPYMMCM
eukprot:GHVN01006338.1.p1 GENE.GHVN01006338.1~~GHVN01006338.1.p1  ORF type:complete len:271 (+),score=15.00 GHVN01006338.1:23-814(+)